MTPFYGWCSPALRLLSHYKKFLELIRSISKRGKTKMTSKPSSDFELVYQPSYYQI